MQVDLPSVIFWAVVGPPLAILIVVAAVVALPFLALLVLAGSFRA